MTKSSTIKVKAPCSANPCQNGGTCLKVGTNGYACNCRANFSGYDSSVYSSSQTTTTVQAKTTTTMRTTCYDIASTSCQNMAIYCSINAYINGIFITDYCPFTCGLCKGFTTTTQIRTTTTEAPFTTRKPACFDLYPECISYAYKGYCLRDFYINDTLIKDCCAFSCGTCVYM
jgi:hypothetical protein